MLFATHRRVQGCADLSSGLGPTSFTDGAVARLTAARETAASSGDLSLAAEGLRHPSASRDTLGCGLPRLNTFLQLSKDASL